MIKFSKNDIPLDLAVRAHAGTSYTPERRGEARRRWYVEHIQGIIDELEQWRTDDNESEMASDLGHYRRGYINKLKALLEAESRVVSQMITGAGGWTGAMVRRNRKRSETADRRTAELLEWSKKTLGRLRRKYDPRQIAKAPVRVGDNDAVEQLQKRLDKHVSLQEKMKAANRICDKKGLSSQQKIDALVELGFSVTSAAKLLAPDFAGEIGFAPFQLRNNNAKIRRLKEQIEKAEREQQLRAGGNKEYFVGGFRVVENVDEDRIQVFLSKEDVDARRALKRRGFNWARTWPGKPWQRQLTENARQAVREVLGD